MVELSDVSSLAGTVASPNGITSPSIIAFVFEANRLTPVHACLYCNVSLVYPALSSIICVMCLCVVFLMCLNMLGLQRFQF